MGAIIAIEGIDAVGKRTQSLLLDKWFRDQGKETTLLSFPDYDTPIGKEIKSFLSGERDFLPELQHILFAANRWEKVPLLRASLEANKIVIVNRYSESNVVYGAANGLSTEWLMSLEEGVPKPELVLVLDAPHQRLTSRRAGDKDSYERDAALQMRARRLYKELAQKFGWVVIDGTKEIQLVHEKIVEVVKEHVNLVRRGRSRR